MSLHPETYAEALQKKADAKARKVKRATKRQQLMKARPIQAMRKTIESTLDALWSQIIRLRDKILYGPLCRCCGKNAGTVACHIVPKQRGKAIRWRLDNGYLGCSGCNWGEMINRSLWRDKHVAMFGRDKIEELEEASRKKAKFWISQLVDMQKIFTAERDRLIAQTTGTKWQS